MNSRGKPLTAFENFKARFEQDPRQRTGHRAERVRAQGRRRVVRSAVAAPRRRQPRRRRVHALLRLRHRGLRVARGPDRERSPRASRPGTSSAPATRAPATHLEFLFSCLRRLGRRTDTSQATFAGPLRQLRPDGAGQSRSQARSCSSARTSARICSSVLPHLRRHAGPQQGLRAGREPPALRGAAAPHRADRRLPAAPARPAEPDRCVRRRGSAPEHAEAAQGPPPGRPRGRPWTGSPPSTRPRSRTSDSRAPSSSSIRSSSDPTFRLEDHPILRGSLQSFELDAATFEARAEAFDASSRMSATGLWSTGALLATGRVPARGRRSRGVPVRQRLHGS